MKITELSSVYLIAQNISKPKPNDQYWTFKNRTDKNPGSKT